MMTQVKSSPVATEPATMRAYVTFLAFDDGKSFKGVTQLAASLSVVGSAYPLVVAVLPDVLEHHRRILFSLGCIVREIEPVYPPLLDSMAFNIVNYSKLRIWEFVEYERMVYLDPGTRVLENIDELFELEKGHFYAVKDCFCDKAWSHTLQYKVGYCQHCPEDKQMAWPTTELGPPPATYFNAKVFVHEPGKATAEALLDALGVTPTTPFAEQDLLNMFFKDEYTPISLKYNFVTDTLLSHPENEHMAYKTKVVHAHSYATLAEHMGREVATAVPQQLARNNHGNHAVFTRQSLPAMATLAASGVVTNASNPAIRFAFYAVFLAAIATVTLSLRGI